MRNLSLVALAFLPMIAGCDKLSYDDAVALAKIGGIASAQTWVVVAKPSAGQIAAVSGALDVCNQALINYTGQGNFADSLPQIYEGISKLPIDPTLIPLADSLAQTVVLGVDFWFSQNPDWKNKGVQSGQIAQAYVSSAKDALPKALNDEVVARVMKNQRKAVVPVIPLPPPPAAPKK